MDEKCKNCGDKSACIPFFAHENALMHYNTANRRMLLALVTVCVTLAIIIMVFVYGNTVREKNLIDLIDARITEVENGVHQQSGP